MCHKAAVTWCDEIIHVVVFAGNSQVEKPM